VSGIHEDIFDSGRLEVARYGFSQGTTAVISTETDFGNVLKGIGGAGIVPAPTQTR
jgi:hypothetical protein